MQFLIIGLDGTDDRASERREAMREDHILMGDTLLKNGNLWYGSALLDDHGNLNGSMYMVDFPSEEELHAWLQKEPYVIGKVWNEITIHKCKTRDPWQFNRPKEWFKAN